MKINHVNEDSHMKTAKISTLAVAALFASALPAAAHDGDHSVSIVANIMHWLSSPTHSLFAVLGGLIGAGFVTYIMRRKRA